MLIWARAELQEGVMELMDPFLVDVGHPGSGPSPWPPWTTTTSQCVFWVWLQDDIPLYSTQHRHCQIVHWPRNMALLFICQSFRHRLKGRGVGGGGPTLVQDNPLTIKVSVWLASCGLMCACFAVITQTVGECEAGRPRRHTHIVCSELLGRAASIHRM